MMLSSEERRKGMTMERLSNEEIRRRKIAAEYIKQAVQTFGSQAKLASEAGLSRSALNRAVRGWELPSIRMVRAVVNVFGDVKTPPTEVFEVAQRRDLSRIDEVIERPTTPPAPVVAVDPPRSTQSPIEDALARVQSMLADGVRDSRAAVRRVVECAERYALAVEQSHAHRLLVFVGAATGAEPNAQAAALDLYDALLGVPELATLLAQPARKDPPAPPVVAPQPAPVDERPAPRETPKAEPASAPVALEYPALARASERNPLLIVGGVAIQQTRERLRELGIVHEWVETRDRSAGCVDSAVKRVRATGVCGVIVLHGCVAHSVTDKLRTAAQLGVVPYVSPRVLGLGELVNTLHILNGRIANGVTR